MYFESKSLAQKCVHNFCVVYDIFFNLVQINTLLTSKYVNLPFYFNHNLFPGKSPYNCARNVMKIKFSPKNTTNYISIFEQFLTRTINNNYDYYKSLNNKRQESIKELKKFYDRPWNTYHQV